MADKKETIKKLRDLFSKKRTSEELQKEEAELYSTLNERLQDIGGKDYSYMENFQKIKGANYSEKIEHVNDFSFKDCCTLLTFIIRGERFSQGHFYNAVSRGDVLKLLERAYQAV